MENSNLEVGAVPATETTPLIKGKKPSNNDRYKRSKWNRIKYYIPVLSWLPKYSLEDFKFDTIAGLTVASILIPQGLSYASNLLNINPIYGLYSCMIPVLVYALLGTSRQISIGPEAVVAIMTGSTVSEYIRRNKDEFANVEDMTVERAELVFLITAIVGVLTLVFGLFRLGFLDSVLSRALLSGLTSAVAVVILFEQIPILLGISSTYEATSPIEKFAYIIKNYWVERDKTTIMISAVCVGLLLFFDLLKGLFARNKTMQLFPHILIVVLTSICLSARYDWAGQGVDILGDVDTNVDIKRPIFSIKRVNGLFVPSILIAIIGFVEALIVSKKYSSKYRYSVSPNRELVAFGSLNIVGSFFGAVPTYASLSRSKINDTSGAKSQVGSLISAGVIFLTIKYLLPYFKYLPVPVMASIISVSALGLIEIKDIIYFFKARSFSDIFLMLLIFFTTIVFSIADGILISVSLSLLLAVRKTSVPRLKILGKYKYIDQETGQEKYKFKSVKKHRSHPNEEEPIQDEYPEYEVEQIEGVIIISFGDNLFFGNTGQLKERFRRIEVYRQTGIHPGDDPHMLDPDYENHPIQEIILDFKNVSSIDACATQILSEIIEDYHERKLGVSIVKLNEKCKKQFKNSGLYDKIDSHRYFNKISDCLDSLSYFVPGLPNGVNWRESEGIIYPRINNQIIHDGASIQWDPISNIWSDPVTPIESSNNENFEDSFIRYRLNRQPTNSTFKLNDNQPILIDGNDIQPQFDNLPSSSSNFNNDNILSQGSPIRSSFNTGLLNNRLQQLNQQQQQQQSNRTKLPKVNPNDSFSLMNNANIWGNGTESEANNISLNFDLPEQIFNTGTEDVFNQTDVWDSKSTKSFNQ